MKKALVLSFTVDLHEANGQPLSYRLSVFSPEIPGAAEAMAWPERVEDLGPAGSFYGLGVYDVYGCRACHGELDDPDTAAVGPWLGDMPAVAGQRVPGMSAEQYIYESILHPDAYIAPDCPGGPCASPSVQPRNYRYRLSEQEMGALIDYLMQRRE